MEMLRRFEPVALLLMIIGALNWAIVALFDTSVIEEIFGTGTVTDVVYVLVGVSALVFVLRLLDAHRTRTAPARRLTPPPEQGTRAGHAARRLRAQPAESRHELPRAPARVAHRLVGGRPRARRPPRARNVARP